MNVYENAVTSVVDAVDAVYLAISDIRGIHPGDTDLFGDIVTDQSIAESLRRVAELATAYAEKFGHR